MNALTTDRSGEIRENREDMNVRRNPIWKQFLYTAVPFGVGMSLLWWVFATAVDAPTNIFFILSFGLLSAVCFGMVLTFYERGRWGQLESTEVPYVRRSEKVVMASPAYHDDQNGWLTLTKHGLLFKVRSQNYRDRLIRFKEIREVKEWRAVGSSGCGIEVDLVNGETLLFEMEDIDPWRSLFVATWSQGDSGEYLRNPLQEAHTL